MNDVWEDLGQIHVDAVFELPFNLTQKITKDSDLINVQEKFFANASE